MNSKTAKIFGTLILAAFLAACGGGASSSNIINNFDPNANTSLSYMISWNAPKETVDNEAINPANEIEYYELYISATGNFSDSDTPAAFVTAVESGQLVTQFDLALLNTDELPAGYQLHVSLKAVGVDGQKSDFMESVVWNRS
jgi:hypothetical protein